MTSGTDYTIYIEGVIASGDNMMESFETTFNWVGIYEINEIIQLSMYPNPADEQLTLDFNSSILAKPGFTFRILPDASCFQNNSAPLLVRTNIK